LTLNITVLSKSAIYQSADFRLSRGGRALTEPSTKRLVLTYVDWVGFVTYTGVGRRGSDHTSDVLRSWFRGIEDATFEQVAETIRRNGCAWLQGFGSPRHTFVVAGFERGVPTAAVISNFERWHGKAISTPMAALETSVVVAGRDPEVLVTGIRTAVSRQDRRALKRLVAEHGHEHTRIRTEMMRLNRLASESQPELISKECLVYSQTADGIGAEVPSGSIPVQDLGLMRGEDLTESIRPLLEQAYGKGGWTLVQSASARSGDRQEPPPCKLEAIGTVGSGYELRVLGEPPGRRATPRSGNPNVVVGEAAFSYGGPSYPCLWPSRDVMRPLAHFGGLGGQAVAVDDSGRIVGHSELPDRSMHAMTWSGEKVVDIHPPGSRSSGVRNASPGGAIAGWLTASPTEHSQPFYRPTIWLASGSSIVFEDLLGGWGEGVYVDDPDVATGFVYHGFQASAWISTSEQLEFIGRPEYPCKSFLPYVITKDGGVRGVQIDANEARHVATWDAKEGWSTEALPPSSVPDAFGSDGRCAGRTKKDDLYVPWILDRQKLQMLPYLRHHHHQVTAIADDRLFGAATTDICSHALEWQRT
jgi:hypothetical protein